MLDAILAKPSRSWKNMPNIAALLKSEISRLSRREIRKEVQPLRKAAATHRREIAALKRSMASLERRAKASARTVAHSAVVATDEKPIRFVAKGLVSLRKRLDLSAADFARLLGVSMQSVYNWERKKALPRKEQVSAIAALRTIGKREAWQRLEVPKRNAKRKPTKPSQRRKTSKRRVGQGSGRA